MELYIGIRKLLQINNMSAFLLAIKKVEKSDKYIDIIYL